MSESKKTLVTVSLFIGAIVEVEDFGDGAPLRANVFEESIRTQKHVTTRVNADMTDEEQQAAGYAALLATAETLVRGARKAQMGPGNDIVDTSGGAQA